MLQAAQPAVERVIEDLEELAQLSAEGPGVSRLAYSAEDADARDWFGARCRSLGLEFEVDRYGNCFGWPLGNRRALLVGSHLDSVPNGGRYDGALGVAFGFEVARAAAARRAETPVGVAAFACEESVRFGIGAIGSRLLVGALAADDLDAVADLGGTPLRRILEDAGLAHRPTVDVTRRAAAYLELHVDQGSALTAAGASVGVVPAIAGTVRTRISWLGEASHSGAHARALRRDALKAAASFVVAADAVWAELESAGHVAALTVGRLDVDPNSPNTVAGRVDIVVDLRSPDPAVLASTQSRLEELAVAAAKGARAEVAVEPLGTIPGVPMDVRLVAALERAADATGASRASTPSLAGHDAGALASLLPTAMLFVANPAGVSHSPEESIDPASLEAALRLVDAALPELVP